MSTYCTLSAGVWLGSLFRRRVKTSIFSRELYRRVIKMLYNYKYMSVESWIGIIVGVSTIIASASMGVRWLVKHYFDEIKHELKPNSGQSMKDQVTRLEDKTDKLESKIDDLYDKFIEYLAKR